MNLICKISLYIICFFVFDNLEHIAVLEEDVLRIEQATGRFLEELKVPLQGVAVYKPAVDRVLQ